MVTFEDESGKSYNIMGTGNIISKILNLETTKAPLKYRTVEFRKNDDEDGNKYKDMLLDMLKIFFISLTSPTIETKNTPFERSILFFKRC